MNLELYEKFRKVPETAKKNIGGGRLKGMTDINPMWRIKTLTEAFGVCGFGWYYEIVDQWLETAMAKDEITANVKINLYVKQGDEWSKPIVGIGGSMLVANEKNGLYVNDECYKMALTDAISVACKSLGIGADVYWNKDNTKYNDSKKENQEATLKAKTLTYREKLIIYLKESGLSFAEVAKDYGLNGSTTEERFAEVLKDLEGK
jgi:hypothetical protein